MTMSPLQTKFVRVICTYFSPHSSYHCSPDENWHPNSYNSFLTTTKDFQSKSYLIFLKFFFLFLCTSQAFPLLSTLTDVCSIFYKVLTLSIVPGWSRSFTLSYQRKWFSKVFLLLTVSRLIIKISQNQEVPNWLATSPNSFLSPSTSS